jgi:hypothetical protein
VSRSGWGLRDTVSGDLGHPISVIWVSAGLGLRTEWEEPEGAGPPGQRLCWEDIVGASHMVDAVGGRFVESDRFDWRVWG